MTPRRPTAPRCQQRTFLSQPGLRLEHLGCDVFRAKIIAPRAVKSTHPELDGGTNGPKAVAVRGRR